MGDFNVKPIQNEQDRTLFYRAMLRDLEAFSYMLDKGMIEARSDYIGAEQELCIVDPNGCPRSEALGILSRIEDERYTNELALYNLEANLSPRKLTGDCFRQVENELAECLSIGREAAASTNSRLLLTGILPTLNFRHLLFDHMTPEERYKVLSKELLHLRGSNFDIHLEGIDDLSATLDSVLFEACNTSFQLHLQIDPAEFALMHNWAQLISGAVLSACTNSPLLFGKELWAENRIALFKQSLDTRGRKNHSRVMLPRVYFGDDWLQGSAADLWKKDVVRFPLLLQGYGDDDPMESLERGITPKLKSIRLHNGTTYTWNRLCYGVANNSPHIRIECRYLPAGPSPVDEIANFAFWIGLMKGIPDEHRDFAAHTDFQVAKSNFIKAARTGIQTVLHWFGKNYAAKELILEQLLPMAAKGLRKMAIAEDDITTYLGIIEARVSSENTGSQWQKLNFRRLRKRYKSSVAARLLVQQSLHYQERNTPAHQWEDIDVDALDAASDDLQVNEELVEDVMNKEVITVRENVSVEAINHILAWQGFHHLPIEDAQGKLAGMISASLLQELDLTPDMIARDIMRREVICIDPGEQISVAQTLMKAHQIGCLPVVENDCLVGILTMSDLTN